MFDMETFKMVHSELIMWMQYIENDLKLVYATVQEGDFDENMMKLEKANFGKIIKAFQNLDKEKQFACFSDDSYSLLKEIQEMRNYWCHQCYVDFHYYTNQREKTKAYKKVAERLHFDEEKIFVLQQQLENLRVQIVKKYKSGRPQHKTIRLK